MKARGLRPRAFICFSVFGTRDEALPSFLTYYLPNESATVSAELLSNIDSLDENVEDEIQEEKESEETNYTL